MNFESFVNRKIKGTLNKWFGIEFTYRSETSKVRKIVLPYCIGKGCDIGFGGDKVKLEMSPYDLSKGRITYRYK